jgi:hypothetical protein
VRARAHRGEGASFGAALLLFLTVGGALEAGPAAAQTCDRSGCGRIACGSPARPVPQSYWGELAPTDPDPLPLGRDATSFDEFAPNASSLYSQSNWYMGMEAQNGYLFTGMAYGLQVWDLRTHPASPDFLGKLSYTTFPVWVDDLEEKLPLQDVASPPGVDTIAAMAGHAGIGIGIIDLSDKTAPHLLYQNYKKNGEQVYVAASLGGKPYAFLAASGGSPGGGVFAYDLNQARQYNGCFESVPADPVSCPGVYVAQIGTWSASSIHGVDDFIVFSSGGGSFEIWNVADPLHARQVLVGLQESPSCLYDIRYVFGVSMWKDANSHYYLALRTSKFSCSLQRNVNEARIYDVTCNLSGTCNSLAAPIWNRELDSGTTSYYVTLSSSNGTPFLYYGSDDKCRGGSQREWLFDVSQPASPRDITPTTGYWGWYYRGGATGFNGVMPREAKFYKDYVYRAGLSIMDIHRHTVGVPPTAGFTLGPTEIYPGTPIQFLDSSTAFPTTWTWTFADAPPSAGSPPPP